MEHLQDGYLVTGILFYMIGAYYYTPRLMMCDASVQSAWQGNSPSDERETACQRRNCSSYLPILLPSQIHARATDVVAGRPSVISLR